MSEPFDPEPLISILTPTRGRPDNITRLITSALDTARQPNLIEFVFYVDSDDPMSDNAIERASIAGARTMTIVGERIVLSEMWNACAREAHADIMMHCGDDIVFRSNNWDEHVLGEFEKYPDKIVLVHGRDGYQDRRLATHGFRHRNWVNVVGDFVPPYFSSDYNDTWVTEVADALGRRSYLESIYTEHMHPVVGKGPQDQTHQERLERHARDNPGKLYGELANVRQEEVRLLQRFIDAHPEASIQFGRDYLRGFVAGIETGVRDAYGEELKSSE